MLILIVDDTESIVETLEEYLFKIDPEIEVHTAENGAVAIELLRKIEPDLIILDYQMPIMDGLEFMEIIQNDKYNVVVITGVRDEVIHDKFMLMGCEEIVLKTDIFDYISANV